MSIVRKVRKNSQGKKLNIASFLCLIFVLIGVIMIGVSVHHMVAYDKVECQLAVRTAWDGEGNNRKAYVTYEYDGVIYKDVALGSFNAFTMKDGKSYMVYINPEKPEWPTTTNYALGILFVIAGGIGFKIFWQSEEKNRYKEIKEMQQQDDKYLF